MKRNWIEYLSHKHTIGFFLVGCLVVTAGLSYAGIFIKPTPFKLLDWLINYEAGFVRRGLLGQVLMEISNLTGISLSLQVFLLQVVSYSVFFGFCYALIVRIHDRRPFLLLIYSPFLFVFQIADWLGGFRKEILFLCILAFLAWKFATERDDQRRFRVFCIVTGLFPVLILSHEQLALFMPYLLFFVFFLRLDNKRVFLLLALGSLSFAVALLTATKGVNTEVVSGICESLKVSIASPIVAKGCTEHNNAVGWLGRDLGSLFDGVTGFSEGRLSDLGPALLLVSLAYLPMAGFFKSLSSRKTTALLIAPATAIILTLVLFVLTYDWGRLLYIHAASVSILIFNLAASQSSWPDKFSWPVDSPVFVWMVPMYLLFWNLEHWENMVGGGLVYVYVKRLFF